MKQSLAIVAVTAVCGGTVAVATTAYANDGQQPTRDQPSTESGGWWSGLESAAAADGPGHRCKLAPKHLPDIRQLPEPPTLLYSEQTVRDPDSGEIRHRSSQTGKVTEVSNEEMSVRSSDGTTWTWTLTDDTTVHRSGGQKGSTSDIEVGDRVLVHGPRDGDTREAEVVSDPPPDLADLGDRLRKQLPKGLDKLPEELPKCEDAPTDKDESAGTT